MIEKALVGDVPMTDGDVCGRDGDVCWRVGFVVRYIR